MESRVRFVGDGLWGEKSCGWRWAWLGSWGWGPPTTQKVDRFRVGDEARREKKGRALTVKL